MRIGRRDRRFGVSEPAHRAPQPGGSCRNFSPPSRVARRAAAAPARLRRRAAVAASSHVMCTPLR
eukprot:1055817-Prymnesium_polylepis.2